MRVLITGAAGLVGSNLVSVALSGGHSVKTTYYNRQPTLTCPTVRLDVRDRDSSEDVVRSWEPDVLINCAAMTDVDACEKRSNEAMEINGRAPGYLAEIAEDADCQFVHLSTDYVFDGERDTPYSETEDTNPIQAYGVSKAVAERNVLASHSHALVLRISFVFGINRVSNEIEGFPGWVLTQLAQGNDISLYSDQHVSPTLAEHVATTIFELIEADETGVFHASSRSCVTPHELGIDVCSLVGLDTEDIQSVSLDDDDREAPRPKHTCLNVERVEHRLGRPQPTYSESLERVEDGLLAIAR